MSFWIQLTFVSNIEFILSRLLFAQIRKYLQLHEFNRFVIAPREKVPLIFTLWSSWFWRKHSSKRTKVLHWICLHPANRRDAANRVEDCDEGKGESGQKQEGGKRNKNSEVESPGDHNVGKRSPPRDQGG